MTGKPFLFTNFLTGIILNIGTAYSKASWKKMGGNLAWTNNLYAIYLTVFQECSAKMFCSWCFGAAKLRAILESAHASCKSLDANCDPASALILCKSTGSISTGWLDGAINWLIAVITEED